MSLRVKGQEVSIVVTQGGEFMEEFTDITDFSSTLKLRKIEQGYLGQTANQYDDILDGCDLAFKMHLHNANFFTVFLNGIIDRATRVTPDLVINVAATMFFPNGQTPRILYPDLAFGPSTQQISSRGDYVTVNVDGSVSRPKFLER